ncbi:hypothetical protein CEB3_c19740 [Peptococcaceae bacterium CEB3]|nr:hypothetical protein CEB3_c19740 [Peptococcaceae bacterium CEB3]
MLAKPSHPRNYLSKFNIQWERVVFLDIIRQDLGQVNPDVNPGEWSLKKLMMSNPRCARWSAIWWLLTDFEPVPEWVRRDAAWVLFKGDGALSNPVPIYAFLDFMELGLEEFRLERLGVTPRVPSISQTTLAHELSLISACISNAAQGKTEMRWGVGKYDLRGMVGNVLLTK